MSDALGAVANNRSSSSTAIPRTTGNRFWAIAASYLPRCGSFCTKPCGSEPIDEAPSDKAQGGAKGTRGGEQSVEGSRQDPDTEADREKAAARSAHEEKIERTRQAIDEARREGRSADAERLRERLDDLEARRPEDGF